MGSDANTCVDCGHDKLDHPPTVGLYDDRPDRPCDVLDCPCEDFWRVSDGE